MITSSTRATREKIKTAPQPEHPSLPPQTLDVGTLHSRHVPSRVTHTPAADVDLPSAFAQHPATRIGQTDLLAHPRPVVVTGHLPSLPKCSTTLVSRTRRTSKCEAWGACCRMHDQQTCPLRRPLVYRRRYRSANKRSSFRSPHIPPSRARHAAWRSTLGPDVRCRRALDVRCDWIAWPAPLWGSEWDGISSTRALWCRPIVLFNRPRDAELGPVVLRPKPPLANRVWPGCGTVFIHR